MAFIEYGGKRHLVPAGEMLVGTGADCHLRLEGSGIALRHAVLTTAPDQSVSIRKLDDKAAVEVNGVMLGPLPQPLLHGDKVTIAGQDLLFVDERKSGSTQYVSAIKLQELAGGARKPASTAGKATAATGGRVVSLTDGREYQIIGGSLKFGRDANSDVVVSGGQVSRRHAEIVVSPRGYILVDSSTNGSWVNGERVQNQRLLPRPDAITLGEEEFRFYADAAAPAGSPAAASPPPAPPSGGSPPPPPMSGPPTPQAMSAPQAPAAQAPAGPAAAKPAPTAPAPGAPPRGAAQLVSTGYFSTPPSGMRPVAPSPRTAEDTALPPDLPPPPAARTPAPPPAPPVRPVAPPVPPPAAPVRPAPAAAAPPAPPAPPAPAPPKAAAAPLAPPAPPPAPPRAAAPPAPPVATTGAMPHSASGAKAGPQALAKFLVRSGSLKGQRLYVKVPIVNIGRADYNDLVIPDDSVSSQHAKLTRREGVWVITDLGSTNGTLVDGERITSDTPIAPGAFVRFGDIQLVFEPTDDEAGMEKGSGTRAISAIKVSDLKPPQGR